MGKLSRIVRTLVKEIRKPDSFGKGEEFEQYVRDYVFPKDRFDLVRRSHDFSDNEDDYIESTLMPDFTFRDKANGKEFHVEVKNRSDYWKGAVEWCKQYQLKRYKAVDKQLRVLIALGVGGTTDYPEEIFLFPVKGVKYPKLFASVLEQYRFYVDKPVFSKYLWGLLK